MRMNSRYGFNVIGLAAVTVVVMLLALVLIPAVVQALSGANMTDVGCRGRDIFVGITGANTEREPLGLPSVWPSEDPPITNTNSSEVECFNFSNSTDYFRYLNDEARVGTDRWNPFVAGFDYSKLAGNGVSACAKGRLSPANNLWTIAMNVRDEMDDILPVLVTRNIDASSLAVKVTDQDGDKSLRFDPEWETPFGDKAFIMIRKGGAIFKARAKYATYGVVYSRQTCDPTVGQKGVPVAKPMKYLTPTRTVVPGDRTYAEGAIRAARLSGGIFILSRIKRDLAALSRIFLPVGACIGVVYLLVAAVYSAVRYRKRLVPCLTGYGLGVGLFHCAAVMLWLCLIFGSFELGTIEYRWTLLALALLAQLGGIVFVIARQRNDRVARQLGVKWMVTAPLIVVGSLFLLLVLGAFAE